jgi:hypothetical protein
LLCEKERDWIMARTPKIVANIRQEIAIRYLRAEDRERFMQSFRKAGLHRGWALAIRALQLGGGEMQKMVVVLASAYAIALPSATRAACSVVGFYSCAAGCGASLKPDWPRVEFVQGSEYRFWNEKGQPTEQHEWPINLIYMGMENSCICLLLQREDINAHAERLTS